MGVVEGHLGMDVSVTGVNNFDIVRGSDATMYIAGLIINELCRGLTI